MQRVIFDPTIIINHGSKILDPNSITVIVCLIYLHIMQCYQFTTHSLIIIHLLVVLVVLVDLYILKLEVLCLLLVLYLIVVPVVLEVLCLLWVFYLHVVLVVLVELCVMFQSLILTLTIQNQCNKMFHQVKTLN